MPESVDLTISEVCSHVKCADGVFMNSKLELDLVGESGDRERERERERGERERMEGMGGGGCEREGSRER